MGRLSVRRPLIGITGPDQGGSAAWYSTRALVWFAGGRAQRLTPGRARPREPLDGLILGGGADIHPARYKAELLATIREESRLARKIGFSFVASVLIWMLRKLLSSKKSSKDKRSRIDLSRDELEFALLHEATERTIPVLGICRGGQLINVYWGGSLNQDIAQFYIEYPKLHTVRPRKLIHVESGTSLARILERTQAKVNSLHDQSVNEVALPLRVSARETNGIIQAIEHKTLPFMIGLQWHPEFLPFKREQRRVFHHLVEAAAVSRRR